MEVILHLKKLTAAESQQLYDQTFKVKASDDKCDIVLSHKVATQFYHQLRIPDSMNVIVMPFPRWHVGTGCEEQISLVVSSHRIYAHSDHEVLDICEYLEEDMLQFYAEHGEVCYFGLYWLPWKPYDDRLWSIRYALAHIDWKNNDATSPYVR